MKFEQKPVSMFWSIGIHAIGFVAVWVSQIVASTFPDELQLKNIRIRPVGTIPGLNAGPPPKSLQQPLRKGGEKDMAPALKPKPPVPPPKAESKKTEATKKRTPKLDTKSSKKSQKSKKKTVPKKKPELKEVDRRKLIKPSESGQGDVYSQAKTRTGAPEGSQNQGSASGATTGKIGIPGGELDGLGGISFGDGAFDDPWYVQRVVQVLSHHWVSSVASPEQRGKEVVIVFTILKNGKIEDILLRKSSGFQNLDLAALNAVRGSSPLPPLPWEYKKNRLKVHVIFPYP